MGIRIKTRRAATKSDAIENVIGRSCLIRGDLTADGAFRIDGTIEGSVESHASVVVGESGVVRGGVRGTDVVIAGTVQGDVICAGHLEILAKGCVEGDIAAQERAHRDGRRLPRDQPHGRRRTRTPTTSRRDSRSPPI
jgi:cytoskeletal protein CcmA (bactofilin family)